MLEIRIPKNPAILRRVKKTEIYSLAKKSVNEIQVPQQKKFFKTVLDRPYQILARKDYNELEKYVSYLYEVLQKLKMCTDKTAIKELNECIEKSFKISGDDPSSAFFLGFDIGMMENILDKANIKNNKYSTLYPNHSYFLSDAKELKNRDSYKLLSKNISQIKDSALKTNIAKSKNIAYYTLNQKAEDVLTTLNDFLIKYKDCENSEIKKHIYKSITSTTDKPAQDTYERIVKNNLLLDAVNIADSKYSPIYSYDYNSKQDDSMYQILLESLNENKENLKEIKESIRKYHSMQRNGYNIYNENKKELKSFNDEHFQKYSKLEYVKNFISKNSDEQSINQYLWNKYFVSKLTKNSKNTSKSDKIVQLLKETDKEIGTKIFFDKITPNIITILKNLKITLNNMKQQNEIFPKIVDITSDNYGIIKKLNRISFDIEGQNVQIL